MRPLDPFLPAVAFAAALAPVAALADTRIFSVETDRPGVTVTAVERDGKPLQETGKSGDRAFFQIATDSATATVPCNNRLAFTASNGQRLEFMVDLCAHNWQVKLPLGTAQAEPPPAPATPGTPPPPSAPRTITVSTDNPNVGIEEIFLDKEPMPIASRQGKGVAIDLPPGGTADCERDLGLALSDGRRIARTVNICVPNGAVVVALDDEEATPAPAAPDQPVPVPPTVAEQPPAEQPPAVPPPGPPLPPGTGVPEVIDNLVWKSGSEGNRATLSYALPNSDQVEFHASCERGSREIDISLDRGAPDVREGASVPVTFTAGTFAKTYNATGSDLSAMSGAAHPEVTVPVDDPLWPALVKEDFFVIQTGSAPAYALSLKGSSAAAKPFLAACSPQNVALPGAPPPGGPSPFGQVGGDYSCSEEGTLVSQRTKIQTQLIFHNELDEPIQLFWLDYNGRRRPYLSLGPGETGVQPTFFTHPWVVADLGGRCLAIYYGRRADAEIAIGAQ